MSRLTKLLRSILAQGSTDSWDGVLLPLWQSDFPVAICWSAKSGCTTVLKWFLQQNGLLDEAKTFSTWLHDYRQQRLFATAGYRQACQQLFSERSPSTHIVKVIRDPAKRAVSSYLHYFRWGSDTAHWPVGLPINRWKEAVGLAEVHGLSFRQFLQYVADQNSRGVRLDPHFRPQYEPLQDPSVATHIPLENLAAGLWQIEERFGLSHVDLRPLSSSGHHNTPTARHSWPVEAAAFPADFTSIQALGTPPAEVFLDETTMDLIRIAYSRDYEAYDDFYELPQRESRARPALSANDRHDHGWLISLPSLNGGWGTQRKAA